MDCHLRKPHYANSMCMTRVWTWVYGICMTKQFVSEITSAIRLYNYYSGLIHDRKKILITAMKYTSLWNAWSGITARTTRDILRREGHHQHSITFISHLQLYTI